MRFGRDHWEGREHALHKEGPIFKPRYLQIRERLVNSCCQSVWTGLIQQGTMFLTQQTGMSHIASRGLCILCIRAKLFLHHSLNIMNSLNSHLQGFKSTSSSVQCISLHHTESGTQPPHLSMYFSHPTSISVLLTLTTSLSLTTPAKTYNSFLRMEMGQCGRLYMLSCCPSCKC